MLAFLGPTWATVLVAAAVFGVCACIIVHAVAARRRQKAGGCPGGCCGCPHAGRCHPPA